jgi:signal transduction histidine kinase
VANRLTLFLSPLPAHEPCSADIISTNVLEAAAARFPAVDFRFKGASANNVDGIMETALIELLVNACEAAPSGIVEIQLETKDKNVQWVVLNSGDAFNSTDEEMDCFAPFTTTRPRHLGLGLPIARRICKYAGGVCNACSVDSDSVYSAAVEISALQR